jgi:hypothetical protein
MICIGLWLVLGLVCLCGTDLMGLDMWERMNSVIQDDDMLQGDDIIMPPCSQVIFRVADNYRI